MEHVHDRNTQPVGGQRTVVARIIGIKTAHGI